MGAHQTAIDRMTKRISLALRNNWPIDGLLDQLFDLTCRATEWDGQQWGFDPDRWMSDERMAMNHRARNMGFYPTEVSKHDLDNPQVV